MTPPLSERIEELVETLEAFEPPTDSAGYVLRDLFEHLHKAQRLAEHLEHDGVFEAGRSLARASRASRRDPTRPGAQ